MTVHLRKGHKGVRNFNAPVRGTDVVCFVGIRSVEPNVWQYSLWEGEDVISTGSVDMTGMEDMTPDQFARSMYLCDVEYSNPNHTPGHDADCMCRRCQSPPVR